MLHLLFICGGEKNKRMRGQKTRSETLKRWGKVLTCEQLKPRRAAIWIQTGGRETLYSTVCRSTVSTERAELWFCLISSRAEQVAQIRKRLLQNNNQKIGKSEWSEWWMNGGSDYAPHSRSFRQNDSVEKSLLYQNPDWTSGTSPIRILNLIGLFLPEPNRYYPSEKAQLCSFPLISRTSLDLSGRMICAASWRKWLSSWSHFILVPEKSIWLPSNIWQHHFFPSSLPKRVGRTYCRERLTSNWRLSERLMYFCVSKLRSHEAETPLLPVGKRTSALTVLKLQIAQTAVSLTPAARQQLALLRTVFKTDPLTKRAEHLVLSEQLHH